MVFYSVYFRYFQLKFSLFPNPLFHLTSILHLLHIFFFLYSFSSTISSSFPLSFRVSNSHSIFSPATPPLQYIPPAFKLNLSSLFYVIPPPSLHLTLTPCFIIPFLLPCFQPSSILAMDEGLLNCEYSHENCEWCIQRLQE